MDFLTEIFHSDRIPPSAEVQAWAEKQAHSKPKRRWGRIVGPTVAILAAFGSVGLGVYLICVAMIRMGQLS